MAVGRNPQRFMYDDTTLRPLSMSSLCASVRPTYTRTCGLAWMVAMAMLCGRSQDGVSTARRELGSR